MGLTEDAAPEMMWMVTTIAESTKTIMSRMREMIRQI
jgi:hypothetical protein